MVFYVKKKWLTAFLTVAHNYSFNPVIKERKGKRFVIDCTLYADRNNVAKILSEFGKLKRITTPIETQELKEK